MITRKHILFLSCGHGLNDCIAGFFLGTLAIMKLDILYISLGLLLYNLLAFGGQYPVALLLEKTGRYKQFLLIAYGLNVMAVIIFPFVPSLAIVLAGVASAIYHVAGGSVCAAKRKAAHIGLFAAPGVAGLIAGGYFAFTGTDIIPWLISLSIVFFFILLKLPIGDRNIDSAKEKEVSVQQFSLDRHDLTLILLLTIISLRSVIWNVFQLIHENEYEWLIAIAIAAFAGKIAGGWIADRIGWRLYVFISLALATPLLTLFRKEMLLFCIGVGLLQSGIPATTSLLLQSMKGYTERAIGLSFGTCIIAGALVFYTPALSFLLSNAAIFASAILMMILFYFAGTKADRLKIN